ncbi:MAG: GPW/gp25 family protein [Desulfitobacterium hafniense]|uniref:GPW/gp25 family protein n=1 Tax=Desulfitobacterium hafniense TaxID=49338 RepID=UPI0003642B8E|nr:GPW/gp25 family protein [Desulfitobacterium hafniense]
MAEADAKSFLGRGFKFPLAIDPQTGKIAMVEHEEDIREAIEIILKTNAGERVMRPEFGSTAKDFVFSVNRLESIASFETEILDALARFEPRIKDIEVEVRNDDGDKSVVMVNIRYVVRSTNNLFNRVYPFYILEGAGA